MLATPPPDPGNCRRARGHAPGGQSTLVQQAEVSGFASRTIHASDGTSSAVGADAAVTGAGGRLALHPQGDCVCAHALRATNGFRTLIASAAAAPDSRWQLRHEKHEPDVGCLAV